MHEMAQVGALGGAVEMKPAPRSGAEALAESPSQPSRQRPRRMEFADQLMELLAGTERPPLPEEAEVLIDHLLSRNDHVDRILEACEDGPPSPDRLLELLREDYAARGPSRRI